MVTAFLGLVRHIKREIFASELKIFLEHGNDKGVIFALRQAGNSYGTNAARTRDGDGEATAVSRIVAQIESGGVLQSGPCTLVLQANGVRAAVIAHHHIALAADPFPVVGSGPEHAVGKQRMAVELNIDGNGGAALFGGGFEGSAELPRYGSVELGELQASFLLGDFFEIVFDHAVCPHPKSGKAILTRTMRLGG